MMKRVLRIAIISLVVGLVSLISVAVAKKVIKKTYADEDEILGI